MSWPTYSTARDPLLGDVLVSEVDPKHSRKERTVLAGEGSDRKLLVGTIAGFAASLLISSAANGGNTGAGVLTDVALQEKALVGVYSFECITEAPGAAVFAVYDLSGNRLLDATEAVAYDNGQISLTIGSDSPNTEFASGDGFTVTVTKAQGKLVQFDPAAVDGSGRDPVIIATTVTAFDGADARTTTLERLCSVKSAGLIWPDGITDAQKSAALTSLQSRFVEVLDSV